MFGLSTELITKGKLATIKIFEYCSFKHSPFAFRDGKKRMVVVKSEVLALRHLLW